MYAYNNENSVVARHTKLAGQATRLWRLDFRLFKNIIKWAIFFKRKRFSYKKQISCIRSLFNEKIKKDPGRIEDKQEKKFYALVLVLLLVYY